MPGEHPFGRMYPGLSSQSAPCGSALERFLVVQTIFTSWCRVCLWGRQPSGPFLDAKLVCISTLQSNVVSTIMFFFRFATHDHINVLII
jgi:hypothetical protein